MGKSWCCAPPHPLPPPSPCVFPLGKAAVSPVITGWLFEASGLLCLHSVLQSLESHSPPPPLPPCVAEGRHWLVSLLSGVLPRPCLSVCLPVCRRIGPSPCVTLPLPLHGVCPGGRLQNDNVRGSGQRQVHTLFIISVNMLSRVLLSAC